MAASVQIRRWTGSGPSKTDITSINTRGRSDDSHSASGTTYPIKIPTSGTNYSYWITTGLYVASGTYTLLDNIRWYTDGTNGFGTGVTCKGNTAGSYIQATGTQGETGIQLTTGNHSGLSGSTSNVFLYTSGSPKTITGSSSSSATGDFGQLFVYQYEVDNTASPGATAQETFTWVYDEV